MGRKEENEHLTEGSRLILTLRPNAMDYKDNWYILSYYDHKDYGYIILAYRGQNSAWDGYGGLNIYTRLPVDFQHFVEAPITSQEGIMTDGINTGLRKVGLCLSDLTNVDNSCCPEEFLDFYEVNICYETISNLNE